MPAGSLLLLIDDIATVLDDVAVLTKVAAKKTAGVLGDDLALNAQQVSGFDASREIPVVLAVAKGSAINKVILVPVALGISALAPVAILPLLMVGGAYLCFEGVEKVLHSLMHPPAKPGASAKEPAHGPDFERTRIRGAIRTDFILSAEIIVISLGTVAGQPLLKQFGVLAAISAIMTFGVYGLVAGIVKLDDAGLHLTRSANAAAQGLGRFILRAAPILMKTLSVLGTAAMFLVGGGILVHGIPAVEHTLHAWQEATPAAVSWAVVPLGGAALGFATGALVLGAVALVRRLLPRKA